MVIELIRQYWKAAVLIALLAGYSGYVYHAGKLSERAHWQAKEAERVLTYQNDVDALHRAANAKSAALEKTLAEQRQKNRALNGRLHAELEKNRLYRECVLPADGVRILNDAAAAGRITTP